MDSWIGFEDVWGCLSYSEQLNSTGQFWTSAATLGAFSVRLDSTELLWVVEKRREMRVYAPVTTLGRVRVQFRFHLNQHSSQCNSSSINFHWTAPSSSKKNENLAAEYLHQRLHRAQFLISAGWAALSAVSVQSFTPELRRKWEFLHQWLHRVQFGFSNKISTGENMQHLAT